MAIVAGLATTSSFAMVKFERNPSAPTTGKLNPAAAKMGSKLVAVEARFGSFKTGGAGVLERPSFDQSQFDPSTQVLEGGDIGRSKDRKGTGSGDSYRVLLVDDARHSEKLVAKVLPQVVPSVTPDDARKLFHESRENGVAIVIVTVKEHAEFYSQMMVRGGLRSIIEPDSSVV
ncbi:putative gluconokinase-like [Hibiscus syriacus]|uniref:Gluconokinase-like n=1 Tax=Hibiscus syriacus TaxID=106335 RepID=A0A6A2Z8T7_HIBSY|nr:ATP-dependent Clp protease adapter protein CLPS2, chloroplastic-like [Hibiscus syriacus]XP_039017782.1 ATP-dependent Clp protease adapter protein CLPS2, chloroplastic-like [Hibiscus syriacus]KAE8688381.1 putative gluconokinase-like [Hibiscus syriacus]